SVSARALFYALWSRSAFDLPANPASRIPYLASHRERLSTLLRRLCAIRVPSGTRVTVNAPEGYAFYALYPEQYCVAAERWLADHPDARSGRTLVVGARSIGTSLSAVVAGWVAAPRGARAPPAAPPPRPPLRPPPAP